MNVRTTWCAPKESLLPHSSDLLTAQGEESGDYSCNRSCFSKFTTQNTTKTREEGTFYRHKKNQTNPALLRYMYILDLISMYATNTPGRDGNTSHVPSWNSLFYYTEKHLYDLIKNKIEIFTSKMTSCIGCAVQPFISSHHHSYSYPQHTVLK